MTKLIYKKDTTPPNKTFDLKNEFKKEKQYEIY